MFFKNVILRAANYKNFEPPINSRAAKKVWRAAYGPRAALWPCLVYMVYYPGIKL